MIDKKSSIGCQECFIEYNSENTSDHNSINAKLIISSNCYANKAKSSNNLKIDERYAQSIKYRINWNSDTVVGEFYNFFEVELEKIKVNNILNLDDNVDTQNKVDKIYKDIVECFKKANDSTSKLFGEKSNGKAQSWWSKELEKNEKVY
jgi:hypothetical protein